MSAGAAKRPAWCKKNSAIGCPSRRRRLVNRRGRDDRVTRSAHSCRLVNLSPCRYFVPNRYNYPTSPVGLTHRHSGHLLGLQAGLILLNGAALETSREAASVPT